MDALRNRAETEKIAALLGVEDATRLAFLHALPHDDLRRFRQQTVAALHDGAPDMLDRIAGATKLVPAAVSAAISQKALGPRLAAAVAGRLEPARAAAIIEKLPVSFTASSCAYLDPRRIPGIVDRLDGDLVVRIAVALAERGDHLTMGRFVGHLRDEAISRILGFIEGSAVLRTGFYIDEPARIGPILDLLGAERLARLITTAGTENLWPEALAVAAMADDEHRRRIASLTAAQSTEHLDSLVRAVHEGGLWESLLPLVALLDDDEDAPGQLRTVAALPSLEDGEVLAGVVPAVVATGLWAEFLPLVAALPDPSRVRVAEIAGELPDEQLRSMIAEIVKRDLWEDVLPVVELMPDTAKERVLRFAE
ncbi:hypothetical protein [Streptomyces iconiensis]|uniref:DUF2336 domain-containing protein n=1 Tax=Streptomyces iconiensis TaxID=1384038 RepID=A0ABT6ZXX5_9ACTN|nr:hypothetical protein [Streptomyces iconiensis]MDJ1133911.1 hypothetical protein [Streptomyces iconiensis]